MIKLNILVTTVGGLTSPDILRVLKGVDSKEYKITIIGTDAFEFAIGKKFVDFFELSPDSNNDKKFFATEIEKLVKKYNIDVIIPCGNTDNLSLAKYRNLISCKVMVSEYEDLLVAYDKGRVYSELKKSLPDHAPKFDIVNNYTDFLIALKNIGYPSKKVVIKPRFGTGGRGVYILDSKFNFDKVFKSKPINEYPFEFFNNLLRTQGTFDDLIVMEYLHETYYSLYSICKDGVNIFTLNHIREWGNASQTFRGRVFYDKKMEDLASKIIKKFNLSYTNNMELATADDGRIVVFDLNPRIGASSGIDKDIGFNFPLEAVNLVLGKKIFIDKSKFLKHKRFLRFFDQVWE